MFYGKQGVQSQFLHTRLNCQLLLPTAKLHHLVVVISKYCMNLQEKNALAALLENEVKIV